MSEYNDFEIRAAYNPALNGLDLYFVRKHEGGRTEILQAPELWDVVTIPDYSEPVRPTMFVSLATVQSLVDALDKQGYRPDSNNRALGELEATKQHLEDMRRIVFDALDAAEEQQP